MKSTKILIILGFIGMIYYCYFLDDIVKTVFWGFYIITFTLIAISEE